MLLEILKFKGVRRISKDQQSKIGGGQTCRFTINNGGLVYTYEASGFMDGAAGSSQANSICVDIVINEGASCGYDCGYDGFGQ